MPLSISERIRNLLTDIVYRGAQVNDKEICEKADKCMALLDRLEMDFKLEIEKRTGPQEGPKPESD